jgi:hypothetical protein
VNAWVWLGLILLVLVMLIVLLLASYLRLETLLSEREQIFQVRWLGNKVVADAKVRELSWWFFAWRILHKPFRTGTKPEKPKEEKKPQEKVSLRVLLEERQRLRSLWRYFKHSVHIERFELNAHLATPDPAWTGMLYGVVSSVIYPLKAFYPNARLHVRADFAHDWPSGTLELRLGVYMFRLAVLGLKALPLIRKLRKPRDRKEGRYGSPNPSQGTGRGYASSS